MHWEGLYEWCNWPSMDQGWLQCTNTSQSKWLLSSPSGWWTYFSFWLWGSTVCEGQLHCGSMSTCTYNSCLTEWVAPNKTVAYASLTSYKALDVVGFAQFKQKYEQWMEEHTRLNAGRITKEEFQEALHWRTITWEHNKGMWSHRHLASWPIQGVGWYGKAKLWPFLQSTCSNWAHITSQSCTCYISSTTGAAIAATTSSWSWPHSPRTCLSPTTTPALTITRITWKQC